MDLSDALFSPSKARQQQAQAKDWVFVESWLSRKYYPKPVPTFERNEETLQALMTLVAFNERADEERELLEKVERQALKELEEKTHDPLNNTIYETLASNLHPTTQSHLTALAESSILLNTPSPSPQNLATHTQSLTSTIYELEQQISATTYLSHLLSTETTRLGTQQTALQSLSFTPSQNLPSQATQWTRDAKTLSLKLDEYNERLTQYRNTVTAPRPDKWDLQDRVQVLKNLRDEVRELDARIAAFEGLPPDVGQARLVLEEMKAELRQWVERRDRGFEGLVDGGGRSRLPIRRG